MSSAESASGQGVVIFATASGAYASDKALRTAGLGATVIPVPRSLSTDCCLGLRIEWAQREQVKDVLRAAGIAFAAVFPWP
jgi:hypothetical protein